MTKQKLASQEQLITRMQEARVVNAADNVLYPLMELMIAQRLELACSYCRENKPELVFGTVSAIAGLKDIMQELKTIQTRGNRAQEDLNKLGE